MVCQFAGVIVLEANILEYEDFKYKLAQLSPNRRRDVYAIMDALIAVDKENAAKA